MTLDDMKSYKELYGYTCDDIARETKIPVSTVRKIFGGVTKRPRRSNMEALAVFFTVKMQESKISYGEDSGYRYDHGAKPGDYIVAEPGISEAFRIPVKEKYTISDLEGFPEGIRAEILDGELFVYNEAPTLDHQDIVMELAAQTYNFIRENHGKCKPFVAPADVKLIPDSDENMVEPDFFVVCDPKKLETRKRVIGAPDWVVEVLSPSTGKRDMIRKKTKYRSAGVREYWVIDPDSETITVFDFDADNIIHIYSFEEKAPVGIYDGALEIDLSII